MIHYTDEHIDAYILDTLQETERTILEDHVFSCDVCLEQYMRRIEINEHHLPSLSNLPDYPTVVASQEASVKKIRPFIHYAIAAAITFLLMGSGIFQQITGLASTIEDAPKEQRASISQSIMDRALHWLDFKQESSEEGKKS